jgi:hypothetical protein
MPYYTFKERYFSFSQGSDVSDKTIIAWNLGYYTCQERIFGASPSFAPSLKRCQGDRGIPQARMVSARRGYAAKAP